MHSHTHKVSCGTSQQWAVCQKQAVTSCFVSLLSGSHNSCARTNNPQTRHFKHVILTSSHLMNLPPFFSASWTHTGLSCSAWTPGLAPAMARDTLPGCQRLNPGYGELDSSEGIKRSSVLHLHPRGSFSVFPGRQLIGVPGRGSVFHTLTLKVSEPRESLKNMRSRIQREKHRTCLFQRAPSLSCPRARNAVTRL